MNLYRVQFEELFDPEEGRNIGRAMCYVTADDVSRIRKVVGKAIKRGRLHSILKDMPVTPIEKYDVPEGKHPFSITVGGVVSFLAFADDEATALKGLAATLDQPELRTQLEIGNVVVRRINMRREGVW